MPTTMTKRNRIRVAMAALAAFGVASFGSRPAHSQVEIVGDFNVGFGSHTTMQFHRRLNRGYVGSMAEGRVHVFDLTSLERVAILGPLGGSGNVSLSPDEKLVLVPGPWGFGYEYLFLHTDDHSSGWRLFLFGADFHTIDGGLGWSPNGSHAFILRVGVVAGEPTTLHKIDAARFTEVSSLTLPAEVVRHPSITWPRYLAIPPSGSRGLVAQVGGSEHRVLVVDLDALAVVAAVDVGAEPVAIAFDESGRRAFVAASGADTISILDIATATVTATIPTDPGPVALALDEQRRLLAVGCSLGGTVQLFDLDTLAPLVSVPAPLPWSISLVPHLAIGLVPKVDENVVRVLDLDPASPAFGTIIQTVTLPPCSGGCGPTSVELHPTGRTGYVLSGGSRVDVLSLPLPAITIDVVSSSLGVAAGSRLNFDARVINNSTELRSFDAWIDIVLPNGRVYPGNPVLGPVFKRLGIGQATARAVRFPIGLGVPPSGPYILRASVGSAPGFAATHTSSFRFFVE